MGGPGSGNRWRVGKNTVESYFRLDVRWLRRAGYLRRGWTGSIRWTRNGAPAADIDVVAFDDHLVLDYRQRSGGQDWSPMRYPVRLDQTACHLGGMRLWFRCPAQGCGRRVAFLYGGTVFACRKCHQLVYGCQNDDRAGRAMRRADKLRERLDWEPGIANQPGGKPRWMRWRTFNRLVAEHNEFVSQVNRATLDLPLIRFLLEW